MHITERLALLREHCCHAYYDNCAACRGGQQIEEHLDAIQAEVEELLKRIPATDTTPAHITLTAH